MKRLGVTFVAAALVVLPLAASASAQSSRGSSSAVQGVDLDAKLLTSAKVQSNGQKVGSVEKVMVNPQTGRIDHVDIKVTQGQNRTISVPWSDLRAQQDNRGNVVLELSQNALQSSPAASPRTDNDKQGTTGKSSSSGNYNRTK